MCGCSCATPPTPPCRGMGVGLPSCVTRAIWVMQRDGSGQRQLTHPPKTDRYGYHPEDYDPAWSPDGRIVYFSRVTLHPTASIFSVHADGSGLRRLTRAPTDTGRSDPGTCHEQTGPLTGWAPCRLRRGCLVLARPAKHRSKASRAPDDRPRSRSRFRPPEGSPTRNTATRRGHRRATRSHMPSLGSSTGNIGRGCALPVRHRRIEATANRALAEEYIA